MLHLIPAPLHRLILRVGHRTRIWWRRRFRRPSAGVSFIGLDDEQRVLLVRHAYGSGRWCLPGGGLGRHEDPADCARREMREELGCAIDQLRLVAAFDETMFGAPHQAYVFTGRFVGEPRPDGREVVETRWFALDSLPPDLVRFAAGRLERAFPHR